MLCGYELCSRHSSKGEHMKNVGLVVLFAALIFAGIYVKAWQCEEMFPNADLMACLFWK